MTTTVAVFEIVEALCEIIEAFIVIIACVEFMRMLWNRRRQERSV